MIASELRWGFGQIIGTLGGMSTSLEALVQTAKTPAQNAAYEQFEIARDAFRRSLYPECLEALGKAISGDHTAPGYKLEWRFHNLVGVVRLGFPGYDESFVDPAEAEESFLLAARYARGDAPGEASQALFSAGRAALVQFKLPDALQHFEDAIAIDPKFAEALFQSAKVRMAQGDPDAALPALRRAINVDHGYAWRAAGDEVFRQHARSVDAFLEALRNEKAGNLQLVARARLAELAPLIAKSAELAGHRTVRRLTEVAEAAFVMGLMELWGFEKDFDRELSELISLVQLRDDAERKRAKDAAALAERAAAAERAALDAASLAIENRRDALFTVAIVGAVVGAVVGYIGAIVYFVVADSNYMPDTHEAHVLTLQGALLGGLLGGLPGAILFAFFEWAAKKRVFRSR